MASFLSRPTTVLVKRLPGLIIDVLVRLSDRVDVAMKRPLDIGNVKEVRAMV